MTVALAACGLGVLAPGALASGAPQGPPTGPTSPPFYQCPAIGLDTTCEYLIDVTSTDPKVAPTIIEDPSQSYYDGSDDVTVAVQNDSSAPLSSLHVGVAGSSDNVFGLDGDGLCNPGSGPSPDGCPFGPAGNNSDPFDYYGPDAELTPNPGETDAGTVTFPIPLQPGQYTYFSLEAPPPGASVVAGEVNDIVTTTLTDAAEELINGPTIAMPAPANVTDQASLLGPNVAEATGKVTYRVYSDATCTTEVFKSEQNIITPGTIPPSAPVGAALPTNATYYWVAEYSGNEGAPHPNTKAISACGSESMTFGTPPQLPASTISTTLTGSGGQSGAQITVPVGTAVTDKATIFSAGGIPVSGRLSYEVYTTSSCIPGTQIQGAGGGITTGVGPASSALTLPVGTYYYQAAYSGSSTLHASVSTCGSEVLTVVNPTPPPPPPPPPPSSRFNPVGSPQVNTSNGQLVISAQFPGPGTETASGVIQHGATLARVIELPTLPLAQSARHHARCKRGYVKRGRRCISDAPVVYGTTSQTIPGAGTYSIVITPTGRALSALRAGRRLTVTVSITFLARGGTVPVTHLEVVSVKLKPKRHHHGRH